MPLLQVFKFPHPMLKKQAKTVTRFDDDLRRLAANMLDTMYEEGGIGLAANQVGQLKQMVVMDLRAEDEEDAEKPLPGRKKDPRVFVNPTMLESGGEIVTEEGCLSVVDFTADVKRKQWIRVAYQTAEGESREEAFEDLAAVCLQHEMDHLKGRLFIDHLPPLKRRMIKKRLSKIAKSA